VARKTYPLTAEHIRKRMAFAEGYSGWEEADWDKVVYADECTVGIYWNNGQVWVQRGVHEAFLPENMADKYTHCEKINVWSCITAKGVGTLYTFTETMTGQYYADILDKCLLESVDHLLPDVGQWYYLHDNASTHHEGKVKAWLHNHGVICLDFPPHSPDLNPVENLWSQLKRLVEDKHAKTIDQLQDAVHASWHEIQPEYLEHIVHSMPKRLQQVRAAQGWRIHH